MTRQLWAPWRLEYVVQAGEQEGCVFCLEAAGTLGDDSLVVHRGSGRDRAAQQVPVLVRPPDGRSRPARAPSSPISPPTEAAEIHALTVGALDALRRVYAPDAFNVGWNLGAIAGGSIAGAPPRARRAPLVGRHELHAGARGREGRAGAPAHDARAAARGLARVIRELAENPNVHQPLSAGRELVVDPAGRYAVYLGARHDRARRDRPARALGAGDVAARASRTFAGCSASAAARVPSGSSASRGAARPRRAAARARAAP